jgi:hypothetical protein
MSTQPRPDKHTDSECGATECLNVKNKDGTRRLPVALAMMMSVTPLGQAGATPSGAATLKRQKATSSAPSLADTQKWITQTYGDGSHIVHKGFQSIDFDSSDKTQCHMHFMVREQVGSDIRFLQLVNLADIDPTSIKASEVIHDTDITTVKNPDQIDYSTNAVKDHPYVFVSIKTTDDKDSVIENTYLTENGRRTSLSSTAHEIGFPQEGIAVEKDYAPRFVNALRHAVELCGGKRSAF